MEPVNDGPTGETLVLWRSRSHWLTYTAYVAFPGDKLDTENSLGDQVPFDEAQNTNPNTIHAFTF